MPDRDDRRESFLRGVAILGLASIPGCGSGSAERPAAVEAGFTEVTAAAGIVHTHAKPALDPSLENIEPLLVKKMEYVDEHPVFRKLVAIAAINIDDAHGAC